ncbi:MAG: cupin domain-containing protein [Prevotella sp.]|jgi:mannose-6-phosphate isomerase-like protein (cupin superfamily)
MKNIKTIAKGANFAAVDFGKLSEIDQYVLDMGAIKVPGKVFGGQALGATGGEFSFQIFQPGQDTGFLHSHKNHEELYFILKGQGEYQVDGKVFPIKEGSVVRVAPDGKRALKNTGKEPLLMLCVQYRGNTFTAEDASDGNILKDELKW